MAQALVCICALVSSIPLAPLPSFACENFFFSKNNLCRAIAFYRTRRGQISFCSCRNPRPSYGSRPEITLLILGRRQSINHPLPKQAIHSTLLHVCVPASWTASSTRYIYCFFPSLSLSFLFEYIFKNICKALQRDFTRSNPLEQKR